MLSEEIILKLFKRIILNIRPAFISIFFVNLLYGNSYNRREIVTLKKYNVKFFIDPFNFLGSLIKKQKVYEYKITNYILKNLNKNSIFFDIGCNEGYYTALAYKKNLKERLFLLNQLNF